MKKNSGQKLYEKAKTIIPGGTMLLSKRPEMFLPNNWPSYFSKAKGVYVWDIDGNKYMDASIMGIGTNTLGYGNLMVDKAVKNVINLGNLSTLNCPEEVYLAEKLIEIEPWADMVRFARSGGEANAISVRIARAASGKDGVAYCGYHGWHDWYLSANHNSEEDELQHQLLPGLSTDGIPKALKNTSFPFFYNDIESLEAILKNHSIGVIKMEVFRNMEPENGFLEKVRQLATKYGAVLIFDECTSGFRETYGGLHKKYNVVPDLIMFGKTLGNGYAITAVVGKKEVMSATQKTFISSTFWTERIGPTAALTALSEMEKIKSWELISTLGKEMKNLWRKVSEKNNLSINVQGLDAIANYTFNNKEHLLFKTYLTQEMLKNKILGTTAFYASTQHNHKHFKTYEEVLDKIYYTIRNHETGNLDLNKHLNGPICHGGMKRLN